MEIETNTVSTDPWKFSARAKLGDVSASYIGEEGESRAKVKNKAVKLLEAKLAKMGASRNGN